MNTEPRQRVLGRLIGLLGWILQYDLPLTEDTQLVDELGLSSSVALYLLLELEEDLDVHIPVEGLYEADVKTIGNLTDYIVTRWELGSSAAETG
jgi:acyl carrier protein